MPITTYKPQSLGPPYLLSTQPQSGRFRTHNRENRFGAVGNWIYFWISHQYFASFHGEEFFCGNYFVAGYTRVWILSGGLKHREEEFSLWNLLRCRNVLHKGVGNFNGRDKEQVALEFKAKFTQIVHGDVSLLQKLTGPRFSATWRLWKISCTVVCYCPVIPRLFCCMPRVRARPFSRPFPL